VLTYLVYLISSFVSGSFKFNAYLNTEIIDLIIEALFVFIIPLMVIAFRKKLKLLFYRADVTSVFLTLLLFSFLFAPMITFESPEYSQNLSMTRMLPPFSKVEMVHIKTEESGSKNVDRLLMLKKKITFQSTDENIEYIDSISSGEKIVCYQKNNVKQLNFDKVIQKDGKPYITTRIFLLGTDEHGRDIVTRIIYGTRISLFIGILSVIVSLLIGVALGFAAGFIGGYVDSIISRITDMFLAFPIIFFVVLILALFGSSVISVIIVLGLSGWMSLFKIVKAEVINIKTKDYFLTAKMVGLNKSKLLIKEILPVIMIPVTVNIVFLYGNVILAESALSYLGLGVSTEYPSWGKMIESGQEYMHHAWWLIFFPGLMLIFTLLTANKIGLKINRVLNPRIN
jgi:peptide/nickel transport system permease protein